MPFCTNCGCQLVEGAKFCSECGSKVITINEAQNQQRRIVYEGEIHKCPNCGDIIDAYELVCETCGFELRGRKTTSVVHELYLKIEQTADVQKKDELIRTFYIPNTKEDIYEFFILALSNIRTGGMNTDAWMVKIEQAYQKAEISFNGTCEFDRLVPLYKEAKVANKKNATLSLLQNISQYFKSGYTWALLFAVVGFLFRIINIFFESDTLAGIGKGILFVAIGIVILTLIISGKNKHTFEFINRISHHFKSGYAWALLSVAISFLFRIINILFESDALERISDGTISVALWIVIITLIINKKKKK